MYIFRNIKASIKDEVSRSIINRSGKLIVLNLAGVVFLFFTNFFLIKLLGESIYGHYVMVNVWLSFFTIIVIFGMDDLFIAVLPKKQNGYPIGIPAPMMLKWGIKLCFALLVTVVAVVTIILLNSSLNVWFKQYALYLLIFFGMLVGFTFLNAFFRGINLILKGQFLEKIVRSAGVLLFILIFNIFNWGLNFKTVLLFQAAALFICIVTFLWEFNKRFNLSFEKYNYYDSSGKSNLQFLGISLLNFLSTRLDILMLTMFSTPEQVGYYNIAGRISDLLGYPSAALYLIIPTFLSKEWIANQGKAITILKNIVLISGALVTMGIIILLFAGRQILHFFGTNFVNSYWAMIFLSIVNLLAVFSLPLNTIMMISGKQKFSLLALFAYVVFIVVLSLFMIPEFGANGAALSMLCGAFFYLLVTSFLSLKLFSKGVFNRRKYNKEV